LPSGDEYFSGIYRNNVQDPDEEEAAAPAVDESLADSVREAAQQALDALKPAEAMLNEGQYEDARMILARPRLAGMGIKISPSRSPPKTLGAWASKCTGPCKESMMQARNSFQLLEEWCFSNRIVFYNKDDQKIINRDMEQGKAKLNKMDVSEPLEYLRDGIASLKEIK